MTPALETPLHFAAHLFAVFIALGAAVTVLREPGRLGARLAASAGFLALAAGEAIHGGDFAGEVDQLVVGLRAGGALVVLAAFVLARIRLSRWLVVGLGLLAASEIVLAATALTTGPIRAAHALRVLGFVSLGWYVLAASARSIRSRITGGFVAVLLLVVLSVSVTVTSVINRNLREGALERLRGQAVETRGRLAPEIQFQARALVLIVQTQIEEVLRGEPVQDTAVAQQLSTLLPDVDFLLFLDATGVVLGQVGVNEGQAVEVAGTDVVQESLLLAADAVSLDTLFSDRLALLGASPIRRTGQIVGVAVVGRFMDRSLLGRITVPGGRAAAFRGAEPVPVAVAGTFPGVGVGQPMLPRGTLQETMEAFLAEETRAREQAVQIGGEDYFVALTPLERADRRVLGILMVAEPAAVVARTQQEIGRLIFLVTLAVVGLALLLAMFASRRITGPVIALTAAARRVRAGDLAAKAEVAGDDEVGDLARAFNQMTDSVTKATDQLRAAAEAEGHLRDRLETVLNSMGDGLVAVDPDGRVVTYNPAAGRILGLSQEEVLGKEAASILRLRDAEGRDIGLEPDEMAGTVFVRRRGAHDVPVAITSTPLRGGASGKVLGRVFVFRDMSREHEIERMKTEFLANVSHELRTPLTPIIGYSEIMARAGVPAERGPEFAGAILESARRLERIVAMLVDFSAMEGGRMTIEAERASLRKIVLASVERWKERTDRHRFVTKVTPRLPQAELDVSLIRRAFDEILDNAVKYSPDGGTIRVNLSSASSTNGRMLRVDVADEGIGIDEADLPSVLEDFRQVDASDTRTFGGLGLGLAFVRRIVEAHRGTIEVKSTLGEGTTLSFTVPTADTSTGRRS